MNTGKIFAESEWIWSNDKYGENEYAEVYEKFCWEEGKAIFNISVRGDYTLFVNGKFAASNQYGDFEQYKVYDEIDITQYLVRGENSIAILVWYFGESGQRYFTEKPGLIYEIVSAGGVKCYSSSATLSRKSKAYISGIEKRISPQLGYSFLYDANMEDEWKEGEINGFSESVIISDKKEFYKRPIKKQIIGERVVGKASDLGNNRYVIDLGKEIVGLCSFSVFSKETQKLNISYGEILKGGRVKKDISFRDFSFDYIAKPGENIYTNYMLRLACRYIEIESEYPIDIKYVGVLPQEYPVNVRKIAFEQELDNKIYDICLNTLKLCMMEHYVDCPWREQCMYAFDSRNQMLAGYAAFEDGNFEYARANLLLMSKDNRKDGLLSICFPSGDKLTIPSFSLHYVMAVKEYIDYSGDLTLAEEVFEKTESILKAFVNNIKDGLVHNFVGKNYWTFYDWTKFANIGCKNTKESDFLLNSLFVIALDSFDAICKKLERENIFSGIKEQIIKNAKKKFLNVETGLFFISEPEEEPTEFANSLAVISGIADAEIAGNICKRLAEGSLLEATLSTKPFKYDALLLYNKNKYKDVVLEEIRRIYKIMLDDGSSTVWEVIEGERAFDNAGSLCHGWSATPIYYFKKLLYL